MSFRVWNYLFFPLAYLLAFPGYLLLQGWRAPLLGYYTGACLVLFGGGLAVAWAVNRFCRSWLSQGRAYLRALGLLSVNAYLAITFFYWFSQAYDGRFYGVLSAFTFALVIQVWIPHITLALLVPATVVYGFFLRRFKGKGQV